MGVSNHGIEIQQLSYSCINYIHIQRKENSMKVNEERSGKMEVSKRCFECGAKDNFEYKDTVRVYEGDGYYFE